MFSLKYQPYVSKFRRKNLETVELVFTVPDFFLKYIFKCADIIIFFNFKIYAQYINSKKFYKCNTHILYVVFLNRIYVASEIAINILMLKFNDINA